MSGCGKKQKEEISDSLSTENSDEQRDEEIHYDESEKEEIQVEGSDAEKEIQVEVYEAEEEEYTKEDTLDTNKNQGIGDDSLDEKVENDSTPDESTEDGSHEEVSTETSSGWGPIYKP